MAAFRSFSDFRGGRDVQLEAVDSDLMMMYEAFLKDRGVTKNTVSFYMRILRAVYNRAVERNLTEQQFPFKHVYTGIDKTVKRAISLGAIRKIKNLNLSPSLDFARDMFLFSFYTRGMSFIDMAYLRKSDLRNGILSYCRRKTGQQLFVCWKQCMQDIVEKQNMMEDSPYILPILKFPYDRSRTQYKNVLSRINRALKAVAQLAGIEIPLTMYVSRHSWASAAKKKHIPISVISEAMGHDSETTTQIYLASLDCSVIDRANQIILKEL
jgi:integrase